MGRDNPSKPSIVIAMSPSMNQSLIQEVLFGIEEEGIPFTIEFHSKGEVRELAFQAARQSKLNVGIGFFEDCIVLHQRNMPENLFIYRIQNVKQVTREALRTFGINSARVVKSIPFRISQELEVLD